MTATRHIKPEPRSTPLDAPHIRRLPVLLRRAWFSLNQAFRRRIAHLGLTPDQFTVMRTLLENPAITQRKLAELITSDPNTVASLLERMEAASLIAREPHESDRRALRINLTRRGKERYRLARTEALTLQAEVLSSLPEHRRDPFLKDLELAANNCFKASRQSPGKPKRE